MNSEEHPEASPVRTTNCPGSHVLSLDLRSLALARITMGIIICLDVLVRWGDASLHYTDLGLLPRSTLLSAGWNPHFLSVHMASGQAWWAHALFALQFSVAAALTLGYRTRLVTLASWMLLVSLHNRNPWLLNGGDVYLRLILFWCIFLPWGSWWSLDSRNHRDDRAWWIADASVRTPTVRSVSAIAILVQVSFLYWFAALPKTHPSWVADYSAINISLRLDNLITPFGAAFRESFENHLSSLTHFVFEWETWGPFLLWFPFDKGQVRTLAIAVFVGMHVGFGLCFEIGFFPAICVAILLILLPPWFWDTPINKLKAYLPKAPAPSESEAEKPAISALRKGREGVLLLLILYVMAWNFDNEKFSPPLYLPDSTDPLGYTLRLDQRWNMFSPSPPYQDGWWVIEGELANGDKIDLLHPDFVLNWDKPDNIARTYKNQRRRRWMIEVRASNNPFLLHSTSDYYERLINDKAGPLSGLVKLRLFYLLEITNFDGSESQPRKLLVHEHDCNR